MPDDTSNSKLDIPGQGLTIRQRQAAVLDAAGLTANQIAAALDLHQKTVAKWRQTDEEYAAAVREYGERQIQQLEPVIERIQLEMSSTVLKAIRTINKAMDATTKAGTPSWAARLRAAADALNNAKLIAPASLADSAGGGSGAAGAPQYAVIRVELPEGTEVKRDDVVDAEVVPEAREIEQGNNGAAPDG